ncbi:MAG: TraR/DksA C4-type zinc finger protein, partial [Actinomycetota bacterium]|nr:TraR/DksA C4-type zinc finger protein [Actinomycetota bacterium]
AKVVAAPKAKVVAAPKAKVVAAPKAKVVAAPKAPKPPPPKKLPPPLAPSTILKLKERLLEERERHTRQADELAAEAELLSTEREQGDTQFDEESGEGDTVSVERERDLSLAAAARQTVDEIERALTKIDDPIHFGLCVTCGDRIPVARLEVIPWAEMCVKCKARGERRR